MSRIYDNWGRLVDSVLRKEHDRELAYAESLESSFNSSTATDFIFASPIHDFDFNASGNSIREIDFEELRKATRNFRDFILGDGEFNGRLFKGWIDETTLTATEPGFGIVVAVKKRKHEGVQGMKEWLAEINYGQLRHPNLVKLIAYSSKEENLLLVYEFVAKGSLDNHLFGKEHQSLSWTTRIKVAIDVAKAFSFLHGMQPQVIHRECKPANILLDEDFNAKLSDFGLAMNGPSGDMTHVTTEIMGTYGYAAPEYLATGRLTSKCDVYGFGVVLLELLSGRLAIDRSKVAKERDLVEWAKPYLLDKKKFISIMDLVEWLKPFLGNKNKFTRIMDTKLAGQYPVNKAYSVASLALHCLSPESKSRPMMSEVVVALEQL